MTADIQQAQRTPEVPPAPPEAAELQRQNDNLRREAADLKHRLDEALARLALQQETRRAALNLMEDAVASRLAGQRENAQRRRVEEELREAHRRKDEFLATLAHELRNPLAPVRTCLHMLRSERPVGKNNSDLHEMMERQITHIVRLVDDLMDVSRITRGKIDLRREPVSAETIVQNALEISRPLILGARHEVSVSLPEGPVMVHGDAVRLTQVLANLLNNAAKYTRDGGKIAVRVTTEDGQAVIAVRDNGFGIPPDMLSRVFDLFTQIDQGNGRSHSGLGIGLALVRSLVELHGGSVSAQSDGVGKGSEFQVRLPILTVVPASREDAPQSVALRASHRVLVVDDNADAAETLALFLEMSGATVWTALDGPSAMRVLKEHSPSYVILDIGMPGMDGHDVARRMRAEPEGAHAQLIALTGWGQERDRARTAASGFNHHLVKPVDPDELVALLASSEPRAER